MSNQHTAYAHQFDTVEQQQSASSLGMWLFLVTEIMFFGGLFLVYAVYRHLYFGAFAEASHRLNATLGAVNTAILICSSFTMALAVRAAQLGQRKTLMIFIVLTMILGSAFLGVKAYEYNEKFEKHEVPGYNFEWEGKYGSQAHIFFGLYFVMTGLHAFHMVIGIGLMLYLLYASWHGKYSSAYYWPVELSGLYWHFVDIIWIFLFPLLYLIT